MASEANEASTLRVAVGQFLPSNSISENQEKITVLIQKASMAKAELLVLPEASMCSFSSELAVLQKIAQEDSPRFIAFMQEQAQAHQLSIIVGVLNKAQQADDNRVINQLLVINPQGQIISQYTKLHVYDAFSFKESDKVRPGDLLDNFAELGLFKIKGFTVGLINCYDLRFPELARHLVNQGADVLSISAAWIAGPHKEMHWDLLCRTRAIENTAYVLASGQTAPRCVGNSMIVDPMGYVVAGALRPLDIAVHTIEKQRIKEVRDILPCINNRRYR